MRGKLTSTGHSIPTLEKFVNFHKFRGIGFDDLFNLIDNVSLSTTYPPHNIYKVEISENVYEYVIQLPIVGRSKDGISITLNDKSLIVKVDAYDSNLNPTIEIMHSGLALRGFEKVFTLNENMEVVNAKVNNGLLEISLRSKTKEISIIDIEIS